ncbi:hypothetical protein D3C87_123510 [compost metagenome]
MTSTLKKAGVILLALISFGFKGNEIIELEGYLNARGSANFLKSTNNVKFVLPPGTKAKITDSKTFNSGNAGLLVEVLDGPKKGEQVWVYYNESNPTMKLYKDEASMDSDTPTKKIDEAKNAKTTQDTPAIRAPASVPDIDKKVSKASATVDAKNVINRIETANSAVKDHGKPGGPCADCKVSQVYARDLPKKEAPMSKPAPRSEAPAKAPVASQKFTPRTSQDTPRYQTPSRTMNPFGVRSKRCQTRVGESFETCIYEGESLPGSFKFSNYGPNNIVQSTGAGKSRDWEFNFQGNARQDIYFSITDSVSGTVSQLQESYFMVFPRTTVPTIRVEGGRQIVTLPNGETVTYDANTKAVIGGVLSESSAVGARPAQVKYHGNGVMLRVDARGKDPRVGGTATITKQGKSCSVPTKQLWPNQSSEGAMHFKYFSDSDFNDFLKTKCGFGL